MALVSVIVPTYNREETVSRAIDSVLAQTYDELEVVVVDDGSTDDTRSVLESYDDDRVRPIYHETNQGANVARNTGIEHARGKYVAFLDSDDEWRPEKLEAQLDVLEKRSEEWVAAYCGFAFELTGPIDRLRGLAASVLSRADDRPRMEGGTELIGEILADNVHTGAGSTLIVRTDVAREVGGFDETLDRFQDPEFVLRILEVGKLAYVDEPLVVREETGTPPADTIRRADEQYLSLYAEDVDRFEAEGYAIRSSHDLVLAKSYFSEGRLLRGWWHLARARPAIRHVPGVVWSAVSGVRRRPTPFLVACVGLLVAVVGSWLWRRP
ncbi:glycosyltransferase family 2 protein [Natronococcus sp. JC468]|uniref:glycosyltransferase family 2 protein n=1 Tax=Natronococcus sp. JC468 TaxID=1961921 RepID=UPI00143C8568|nr:glycosyltransferase [Natronococcus sp. JC468]NKE34533.1 glycosyltransferase family 2 protein [Natronococcus sp. JC468]